MNKRIFYAFVSLSVLILLLGSSFLYFNGDFLTGNLIFNTKSSKYGSISTTSKTSCVDSNYANKVMVTTPSTSTTKLKPSSKTQTFYDTCLDSITLKDYYCKNDKIASISKSCEGYCENGKCKPDTVSNLIVKGEAEIASLNTKTWQMDIKAMYDTYTIPGSNFRIVCQQPCPLSEKLVKLKTIGAYTAINKLLGVTKIDIAPHTGPVDIHLTGDAECGVYGEGPYVGWAGSRWNGGYGAGTGVYYCLPECSGSYICLFEYERTKDNTQGYPLNEENAKKIEAQQLIIHEYAHTLFYDRFYKSPEDFVTALSYYVVGDINNNKIINTACNPLFAIGTKGPYNLCKNCSFDFKDYSEMFKEGDKLYISNTENEKIKQGWENPMGSWVTTPQFKKIIEDIIFKKTGKKKDAVIDCGYDSWLSDIGCDGGKCE